MTQELETIGRLQLWLGALDDCIQCIQLCHRMHLTALSPELDMQEEARQQHFQKIISRMDNVHIEHVTDHFVHDSFRRWLPTERECDQVIFHLHRLAAVYFLQIYTKGNADFGAVMSNMTTESKTLSVASRTIIWSLVKQMRVCLVPIFHGLDRRTALER